MRSRLPHLILALFVLLGVVAPVSAHAAGAGSISGTVTSASGTAIADVCVTAMTRTGQYLREVRTDAQGAYALTSLGAGAHYLRFHSTCYNSAAAVRPEYYQDAETLDTATAVQLGEDEARAGVDAVLARTGVIRGVVRNEAQEPLEGVCVEAHRLPSGTVQNARSGLDGTFTVTALDAGDYALRFVDCAQPAAYLSEWHKDAASKDSATAVTVDPEAPAPAMEVALEKGRRISGTLTDDAGTKLASHGVTLYDAQSGQYLRHAWTSSTGGYAFGALVAGSYKLHFEGGPSGAISEWHRDARTIDAATPITATEPVTTVDASLSRAGSIRGTVREGDQAADGMCVRAYSPTRSAHTQSAGDGSYFLSVEPGQYRVRANPCGSDSSATWHPAAADEASATVVEVLSGTPATGIDVTMPRRPGFEGTVVSPAGAGLSGICVHASGSSGSAGGTTGADGRFALVVPAAGTYGVSYRACQNPELYEAVHKTFSVAAGERFDASMTLVLRPVVTGRVVDSSGTAAPDVCVQAQSQEGSNYGYGSARTAQDGTYQMRVSRAGDYTLTFRDCEDTRFTTETATVTTTSGGTVTVDRTMYRASVVSGTVVDSAGQPIADVCVSADSTMGFGTPARTDQLGRYRLSGLPAGSHKIRFQDCSTVGGRYLTEWHLDARTEATATDVPLAREQQLDLGSTDLVTAGRITGTVTDASTGAGLASACVTAHDRAGTAVSTAATGTGGSYDLGGLPTGSYRLSFWATAHSYISRCSAGDYTTRWYADAPSLETATAVRVAASSVVAGVDGALTARASIAGTVTDRAGDGIAGICVSATTPEGISVHLGRTDVSGDYQSGSVEAADYRIRFDDCAQPQAYVTEWYDNAAAAESARRVVLAPGEARTGIDAVLASASDPSTGSGVIGDYDGDGRTDRAVWRPSDGGWYVHRQPTVHLGVAGDVPVPADYDGDGRTDRAVWRPASGEWFVDGAGVRSLGLSGDIPVPGDYDGNGSADPAVYRPSTGEWFIAGQPTRYWGLESTGDVPVPGDYDGNGTTDVAVFRPAVGGWYIDLGSAGSREVFWGLPSDLPVPADYDGDGSTDVAVWRGGDGGGWYRHAAPDATVFWGLRDVFGDEPQLGDFNGDGAADRMVWRPESGGWYHHGSQDATVHYGLGGDIPLHIPYAIRRTYTGASAT